MAELAKSQGQLEQLLVEQLRWIDSSASLFDEGDTSEAKRLAVTLRVLLHQTSRSESLLRQLGMLDTMKFLNTAKDKPADHPGGPFPGLTDLSFLYDQAQGIYEVRHIASLDRSPPRAVPWREFNGWWTDEVMWSDNGLGYSRKRLILALANQEGGAHVDPVSREDYIHLTTDPLGWSVAVNGAASIPVLPDGPAAFPAVRQIAFETRTSVANVMKFPER